MSVGEVLDADTHEVDATNLAEARAMDSARKAAARRENQTPRVKRKNKHGKKKHSRASSKRKTKKQSRARSKPPRYRAERRQRARTTEPRTDPRTHRRRSFIDDVDARAITALYLEDEDDDDGTDNDQMPPLDGSSSEEKQYSDASFAQTIYSCFLPHVFALRLRD